MHRQQPLLLDYAEYPFERAGDAWRAQQSGPHAKIVARIR
jgi:hypothetical protein